MKLHYTAQIVITLSIVLAINSMTIADDSLRKGNRQSNPVILQTVLLNNGTIMQGKIHRQDDYYLIETETGSQLGVRVKDVQFIGESITTAYHYQLKKLSTKNPVAIQNLAVWCMEQKLFAEAKFLLSEAESLAPRSSRTSLLFLRLDYLWQQSKKSSAAPIKKKPMIKQQDNQKPSVAHKKLLTQHQTNRHQSKTIHRTAGKPAFEPSKNRNRNSKNQKSTTANDPQDPDLFNRRFFPERFRNK